MCVTGVQVYINLLFLSNSYINNSILMYLCPMLKLNK